jgi:hypothetical protein
MDGGRAAASSVPTRTVGKAAREAENRSHPNTASLLRLFTAVLQDQHDEWQDGRRHFSQQSMARLLHPDGPPLLTNPLTEGLVS